MLKVDIRAALPAERGFLEALQRRASLMNPGDRAALLAHPDAIVLPRQQIDDGGVFVAEHAGRVLGFSAILARPDGNAELDALFVEPGCWRQGVGSTLVQHCAAAATKAGASVLHVVGNPHASCFYQACGFIILGTHQTRFGLGLLMKKALTGDLG